jgi:5-exo-hydroxycamphor dehydrogenase
MATALGATTTISLSASPAERIRQIRELSSKHGPDVVVEAAGVLQAFPEGVDLAGNHGRYIILGLWGAIGTQPISPRDLSIKNLTIAGASFPKPKHYHGALQLAARLQGEYPLAELVTHRFSIAGAAEALAATAKGAVVKAIIDPELA